MKPWVKENITITAIIASLIIIQAAIVDTIVLLREVRTTETNTTIILQNSNAMAMLVLGYYFVSSKRNKDEKSINIENVEKSVVNQSEKSTNETTP